MLSSCAFVQSRSLDEDEKFGASLDREWMTNVHLRQQQEARER